MVLLIVGLMLGAVLLVGVGERLRLPWPALMVVLGALVAVIPGLPDTFELDPDLILPLFLPPLLYAMAQRTSWAVFRARWRSVLLFAVALVVATVAAVGAVSFWLVPGITVTAAIALGAMVAPPDPVAVEAVAGPVRIPRRLLATLQSEGLFNDATALVIFQAAVLATFEGENLSALGLLGSFVLGAIMAVAIGLVVAWLARRLLSRLTDAIACSALTLVLPFAVYLAAEEVHASGVVAVVVVGLQLRRLADADEAAERLVQRSFWDVLEMLVTGVGFGLIGLDLRSVVTQVGPDLPRMLGHALLVAVVALAVRVIWMYGTWLLVVRRRGDASAAPRNGREAFILSWCGMRGLATLALALSLPTVVASGAPFPARAEVTLIAVVVLLATLLIPGFTLPALVRLLGVTDTADAEERAEKEILRRARLAALQQLEQQEETLGLSDEIRTALHHRLHHLDSVLTGESMSDEDRQHFAAIRKQAHAIHQIELSALAAARAEVLAARREPGVDPEAVDRVLFRLDMRTVLLD